MRIHLFDSLDSTQDEAARMLKSGEQDFVVLAVEQTAGRGRHGRTWESPKSKGLYFSFPWQSAVEAPWPAGIALAAGAFAAEYFDTDIAWPNDLLIDGRKVGGLLCEIIPSPLGRVPVIGIGINLTWSPPGATSMSLEGRDLDPFVTVKDLATLVSVSDPPGSFADIEARWRKRDATRGKSFRLSDGRFGIANEVDRDGALIVDVDNERVTVTSAEAIYGSGS